MNIGPCNYKLRQHSSEYGVPGLIAILLTVDFTYALKLKAQIVEQDLKSGKRYLPCSEAYGDPYPMKVGEREFSPSIFFPAILFTEKQAGAFPVAHLPG